jgi:hypothetical protein
MPWVTPTSQLWVPIACHENWLPAPNPPPSSWSTISWPGCQLLPHTCPDEGIDPIDGAGFRNRAIAVYGNPEGTARRHGAPHISRDICVLVALLF